PPPPPPGGMPGGMAAGGGSQFGPLASWGQRAVAWLITGAMIFGAYIALFIVVLIISAVSDVLGALVGFVGYLALLGAAFYFYYLDGQTGGHPGKRLTGLKTVNADTGELIGGGMGIVRYLAHFVDAIICYIGFLFPLWDDKNQTIADKMMSTVVVADQPKKAFGPELFKA
ncbi:MAG: RDD family protein, partial [Acidimicrobiales bacterium]|nr:RDD family protein [Acidimicrobiales bacterium]